MNQETEWQAPTKPMATASDEEAGPRRKSSKNYAVAVALSAVFGVIGVQHFYLGRYGEGLFDVGLSIGWLVSVLSGQWVLFIVFVAIDVAHSFYSTIKLFVGAMRDGEGYLVCYPGQKL